MSLASYWCFLVNRLNNKFLVIEGDISDLTPGESNFRC